MVIDAKLAHFLKKKKKDRIKVKGGWLNNIVHIWIIKSY